MITGITEQKFLEICITFTETKRWEQEIVIVTKNESTSATNTGCIAVGGK